MNQQPRPILWTNHAQTAIEYMLLLAVVMAIVLVGFKTYVPRTQEASNLYFNKVGSGILGDPPRCGNGDIDFGETQETCCVDVGGCGSFGITPK